ncbi:MAG: hypothetical protein JNL28_13720 [Planctomycetes bacterium]|nr:hypothetical protein [Planctomycetota bacterium]
MSAAERASLAQVTKSEGSPPNDPTGSATSSGRAGTVLTVAQADLSSHRIAVVVDGESLSAPDTIATSAPEEAAMESAAPSAAIKPSNRMIEEWVADLRDDHVKWNAGSAARALICADAQAIPFLQSALNSDDSQQRHVAAYVLGQIPAARPTARLAELLVDNLAEWDTTFTRMLDDGTETCFSDSTYILHRTAARKRLLSDDTLYALAVPHLITFLDSQNLEGRLYACDILARRRCAVQLDRIVEILVWHLCDNRIDGDAARSVRALQAYGDMALPWISSAALGPDAQQRALVGHLLAKLCPQHPSAVALTDPEFAKLGFPLGDPLTARN